LKFNKKELGEIYLNWIHPMLFESGDHDRELVRLYKVSDKGREWMKLQEKKYSNKVPQKDLKSFLLEVHGDLLKNSISFK
jgi:hypothetical protein|tara:strand:+ start:1612 stop:1851 length:240 start_codon:yes stop_codon:yes gene_type:complete